MESCANRFDACYLPVVHVGASIVVVRSDVPNRVIEHITLQPNERDFCRFGA